MATKPIVLTGFMGTGKSSTGQLVAQALGWLYVDMDALIVARVGLSIAQLFQRYGEAHFRAIERGLCHELAIVPQQVVATGGGALLNDDSREAMLTHAFVVCLTADEASIAARLEDDVQRGLRPLASRWRELYAQRAPMYALIPQQIDTSAKPPEQVAQEVIALWNASQ